MLQLSTGEMIMAVNRFSFGQLIIFFCSAWLIVGCVSSPFDESEIKPVNRSISGRVRLSNQISPDDVHVWLDGFDVSARTDAEGAFHFVFPATVIESNERGLSGSFNLYYYLANFKLEKTSIVIVNGELIYASEQIGSGGELKKPQLLVQQMEANTIVEPQMVWYSDMPNGDTNFQTIEIKASFRTFQDTSIIYFPTRVGKKTGPLLFRNIETNEVTILSSLIDNFVFTQYDTVTSIPLERIFQLNLTPDDLAPSTYEVIPYFRVVNSDVPDGLIESLGEDVLKLSPDYIMMPVKRVGRRLLTLKILK